MEGLLYTCEKYGLEMVGIAVVVLFALQGVQFLRMRNLRKQVNQMTERQQLKDDMRRAAQSGYSKGMNGINPPGNGKGINAAGQPGYGRNRQRTGQSDYDAGQSTDIGKEDSGIRNEAWDSDSAGRLGQAEAARLAEEESQLISDVLGEIFP